MLVYSLYTMQCGCGSLGKIDDQECGTGLSKEGSNGN